MNVASVALNVSLLIVGLVVGFLVRQLLPAYFTEKGKNLATKEDIEEITSKVERVKAQYSTDMERLKADIQKELSFITKKREMYHEIVKSLGIFISDRGATEESKAKFLSDYSSMWLWAPDSVVIALNKFVDIQIAHLRHPGSIDQQDMRHAFATFVIEMRKDTGFSNTNIDPNDYKFVSFI